MKKVNGLSLAMAVAVLGLGLPQGMVAGLGAGVSSAAHAQQQSRGIVEICDDVIEQVEAIRPMLDLDDYSRFFMPIKRTAARTKQTAAARGDMSSATLARVRILMEQLENVSARLDSLMERDAAFDNATCFIGLLSELEELLD